jgi:hypothetical protein
MNLGSSLTPIPGDLAAGAEEEIEMVQIAQAEG